jgi:hypothetical protein
LNKQHKQSAADADMNLLVKHVTGLMAALYLAAPVLGQDSNSVIEQSRLFQNARQTTGAPVDANGIPLPSPEPTETSDVSFGKQQILKTEEKIPELSVGGDASVFYTSNVALTRVDKISDIFFAGNAALSWTPRISNELQLQAGTRASIFRYDDTPELDFQSIGAGVGALWTPRWAWGIGFSARYDFIELWDRHSDEILQDHEFSIAAQKILVLGRSHALSLGTFGSVGISDPFAEQRDQIGALIGYHVQLTRFFDVDFGYRLAGYFYNAGARTDFNQILSFGGHCYFTRWASLEGFFSWATNYSNKGPFEYDVFAGGGGLAVILRF